MNAMMQELNLENLTGAEKFAYLRSNYPEFIYHGFIYKIEASAEQTVISCKWHFSVPHLTVFVPESTFSLPTKLCREQRMHKELIETWLYQLGLMESISYWKAVACPFYRSLPCDLPTAATEVWRNWVFNGLGEYLYRNNINVKSRDFIEFAASIAGSEEVELTDTVVSGNGIYSAGDTAAESAAAKHNDVYCGDHAKFDAEAYADPNVIFAEELASAWTYCGQVEFALPSEEADGVQLPVTASATAVHVPACEATAGTVSEAVSGTEPVSGTASALVANTGASEAAAVLIPVGGGKDSVLTLELLKNTRFERYAFAINPSKAVKDCIALAEIPETACLFVKRVIDKRLLQLNERGFLNGHTPFSGIVAFYGSFTAYLSGIPYIALSNEASANAATVEGTEINHQYSKTAEFEQSFAAYSRAYLGNTSRYFSFLRPLNEIAIAALFSRYEQYFKVFRSCNLGSKAGANRWCGNCAKCLFVFIILSPYLSQERMTEIFGSDLMANPALEDDLKALLGLTIAKPFECVGTVEEVNYAVAQMLNAELAAATAQGHIRASNVSPQAPELVRALPRRRLLQMLVPYLEHEACPFIKLIDGKFVYTGKYLFALEDAPLLNEEFAAAIEQALTAYKFRTLFAGKKVLLLGLGLEGSESLRFLLDNRSTMPYSSLTVADADAAKAEKLAEFCLKNYGQTPAALGIDEYYGQDYLKTVASADFVLKSPGIPFNTLEYIGNGSAAKPELCIAPQTEISCQAELFLQLHGAHTVAVSGTKGKSTTTTLVHLLLEAYGIENYLLGNIGIPAFEKLTAMLNKAAALELSCHQLEFCAIRPQVALLTNLHEEHLDHYHDAEEYYNTKLNLLRKSARPADGVTEQAVVLPLFEAALLSRALPLLQLEQRVYYLCTDIKQLRLLRQLYHEKFSSEAIADSEAASYLKRAEIFYFAADAGVIAYAGNLYAADERLREAELAGTFDVDKFCLFKQHFTLGPTLAVKHLRIDAAAAWLAVIAYVYGKRVQERNVELVTFLQECAERNAAVNAIFATFGGLPHRLQAVGTFKGHKVYNDSISTIPATCINAVEALGKQACLIVGGLDRGIDYSALIAYLAATEMTVIGLPTTGTAIVDALEREKSAAELRNKPCKVRCYKAANMAEAVALAYRYGAEGEAILLSPAAASYNVYKDFAARGDDFVKEIRLQAEEK